MPTGYTAGVQDGTIDTLEGFALICSRAFGATIMMRDDPLSKEIPEKFEPNTKYHDESLEKAHNVFGEANSLSGDDWETKAQEHFDKETKERKDRVSTAKIHRKRYLKMLGEVNNWEPHTDIVPLKEYMAEQISGSIDHDCTVYGDEPVLMTGAEFKEMSLAKAKGDLEYHTEAKQKEIDRTQERNKWVENLRASL